MTVVTDCIHKNANIGDYASGSKRISRDGVKQHPSMIPESSQHFEDSKRTKGCKETEASDSTICSSTSMSIRRYPLLAADKPRQALLASSSNAIELLVR